MSTPYDFDRQKESDISKIVPKLKGESNFAQWQHRLYMALRGNNKTYVDLIQGTVNKPTPPDLYDESVETVRELAQHRATSAVFASGSSDPIAPVSDVVSLLRNKSRRTRSYLGNIRSSLTNGT